MSSNIQMDRLIFINGLIGFLGGLITPITTAYLALLGLSLAEISVYLIASRAISLLFETPSGMFSDKYGRLLVGKISLLFSILFTVCLLLGSNKEFIMLAAIFSGLFNALNSGTFDVLLFNMLERRNQINNYGKISGTLLIYDASGLFFGIVIAIPILLNLYTNIIGFKILLITASIVPIAVIYLSRSLKEDTDPSPHLQEKEPKTLYQLFINTTFFAIFGSLFIFYSGYHSIERFFQVFLVQSSSQELQLLLLTSIYFISTISRAYGAKYSDGLGHLNVMTKTFTSVIVCISASILLYLSVTTSNEIFVVVFKIGSAFLFSITFTFYQREILQFVSNKHRSTLTSILNTIQSISIFVGVGLAGVYSSLLHESAYLSISLVILILASSTLTFLLCNKPSCKNKTDEKV